MNRFFRVDETGLTLHIPALPDDPSALLWLIGFGLVLFAFLAALHARPRVARLGERIRRIYRLWATPLGLESLPTPLGLGLVLLWMAIFGALLVGMIWVPWMLTRQPVPRDASGAVDLRWYLLTLTALTAAVGAVAAVPFTLLRTVYNSRQTRTAEENLITGLINKAVEGLGTEKTVNRRGRSVSWIQNDTKRNRLEWHDLTYAEITPDRASAIEPGPWESFEVTIPNPEVRLGAIYALEHIAQDSDRDHVRIMEILCAYVRENTPARTAQDLGLEDWPDPAGADPATRAGQLDQRRRALAAALESLGRNHRIRTDLLAAIEVIGRRTDSQIALEEARPVRRSTQRYRLDLRGTNLQAADLSNLHLANVLLTGARMDGVDLRDARLDGADLRDVRLDGANLGRTRLQGADLRGARMEGASLSGARLDGTNLRGARMEGTLLREARLSGVNLGEARLDSADLSRARLDGANLRGAGLEAAILRETRLDAANLLGARLDPATRFAPASLRGAGLKALDLSTASLPAETLAARLAEAFGDASVRLPPGLAAGSGPLAHWSAEALEEEVFYARWRSFQQAATSPASR